MDATMGSTGVDAELVALRRRAYGPGGDIAADPAAQARLSELEAAVRASVITDVPLSTPGGYAAHASSVEVAAEPESATGEELAAEDDRARPLPGDPPPVAEPSLSTGPWWRSRAWWALIAGLVVVGLVIAGLVAWLTPRQPDAVLRSAGEGVDASEVQDIYGSLDYFGIEPRSLTRFDRFRGVEVWSGPTRYGTTCLLVTDSGESGIWGQACAPEGLDPVVDIVRFAGFEGELYGDMPVGSLLRFVYKGDRVEVYLAPAQPIVGP